MPTGTVRIANRNVVVCRLSRKSCEREHVAVLVEADVVLGQPGERRGPVEAEVRRCWTSG